MTAPPSEIARLNERSRTVMRKIVESYLTTGEPVDRAIWRACFP